MPILFPELVIFHALLGVRAMEAVDDTDLNLT
jgi:hypothetical protein